PQIGKEFDLIRIGTEFILNIELKCRSTVEKIEKQLKRNKYYLSFLGKKIYGLTFVSDSKQLFTVGENGAISEVSLHYLIAILCSQKVERTIEINSLFNPSNYLVSPFNSTHEFIKNEYFLT